MTFSQFTVFASPISSVDSLYIAKCAQNSNNPDSLRFYADMLIESRHPRAAAEGWYARSFLYQRRMQLDSALMCIDQAEVLSRGTEDYAFRLGVLNSKANTLLKANRYDDVHFVIDEMMAHVMDGGDTNHLWKVYRLQGIANKFQGNYEASLQAHVRSSRINLVGQSPELANDYTNIAMCYVDMNLDSLALIWFRKAHEVGETHPSLRVKHRTMLNLSRHFRKVDQLDSAIFYMEVLLGDSASMREDQLFIAWDNLANLHIDHGEGDKARFYLDQMKRLGLGDASPHYLMVDYLFLEVLWHQAFGELDQALVFCDSGIKLSEKKKMVNKLLPLLQKRAMILEQMGLFPEATSAYKAYLFMKDSLVAHENAEAIQRIISEYELEEKERQFEREMEQRNNNRTYWPFYLVFSLVGGGALYAFRRRKTSINDESANLNNKPQEMQPAFVQLQSKVRLDVDSIVYVKSDGHYLDYFINGKDKPEIDRQTISKCFDMLAPFGFIRTHRSYIVNANYIRSVSTTKIELKNNAVIPLSKSCRHSLMESGHPLFKM